MSDTQKTKLTELVEALSEPFAVEEHEYRIISQTKSGFWMAYYVDLRKMEERLQKTLPMGATVVFSIKEIDEIAEAVYALGTLKIEIPDETWLHYEVTDAGYAPTSSSEPPKSAVTDLYRRLLSHFGIGRYLYHLPKIHLSGKNDGGRIIYDADPLDALRYALSLDEKERPEVLFYPLKKQGGDAEKPVTRSSADAEIKDEWLDYFGVDTKEEAIDAFVEEVGVSRKQAVVYMRNTVPESAETGIDKQTVKAFLDKLLGNKR